jgi:hypothetical protein
MAVHHTSPIGRTASSLALLLSFASVAGLAGCAEAVDERGGGAAVGAAGTYAESDRTALTHFQEALDGHGSWVEDPQYGNVWVPDPKEVGADFVPYATAGHWGFERQDASYNWFSDYKWGWAAFHYGRWFRSANGWAWVPGRTYAPAWVEWHIDATTVAWTPSPPVIAWHHGVAEKVARVEPPPSHFTFVAPTQLYTSALAPRDEASLALAQASARPVAMNTIGDTRAAPRELGSTMSRSSSGSAKSSQRGGHRGSEHGGHGKR